MMTGDEYRARAQALVSLADEADSETEILQLELLAMEWRKLADLADWQARILRHLGGTD